MQFCARGDARAHRTKGCDTPETSPIGPDIGWAGWATQKTTMGPHGGLEKDRAAQESSGSPEKGK